MEIKKSMEKLEISDYFKKLKDLFLKIFVEGNKVEKNTFKKKDLISILSPGRVNMIGEHTDYNLGFAISTTINKYIFLTGGINDSDVVEVYSKYLNEHCKFSLDEISYDKTTIWINYIKGVLKEYVKYNYKIGGFNMVIDSNLPIGSGMSSSAALEVGVAKFIEELFNLKVEKKETVEYCHSAENNFIGVNCGFLDQFTVAFGKKNNGIFINFKDLSYEYIPFDLKDSTILIVNSKEKRNLSKTEYNKRRDDCSNAVKIISSITKDKNIKSLSDVNLDLLYELKDKLPQKLFKRARHVITENKRVLLSKEILRKGDIKKLGSILLESHNSLKYDYEVSTEKLDFLVDEITKIKGAYGARLMGAGFGGSIISIVGKDKVDNIVKIIGEKFLKKFAEIPEFIECLPSDGTKRVDKI
jgi:galactokinase